jgi:hypothetical protein
MEDTDFFGFLSTLGFVYASDTAIQKINNEITFENFLVQAPKKNILVAKNVNDNQTLNTRYSQLYDCLVNQNIIVAKVEGWSTLFTLFPKFKIKENLTLEEIKTALDPKNEHYMNPSTYSFKYLKKSLEEIIEFYTIHMTILYDFLQNYNYNETDQLTVIPQIVRGKTGGKIKHKKTKIKKMNQNKRKTQKQLKIIL